MEWISVDDKLPEIPEEHYGLSVLVATFDHQYNEIFPGHGYNVLEAHYGGVIGRNGKRLETFEDIKGDFHFMQLELGPNDKGVEWWPMYDEVTHWMPMPKPPKVIAKLD